MNRIYKIIIFCSVLFSITGCATNNQDADIGMSKYLMYNLPHSLSDGEFSQELGYLGGNLFIDNETASVIAMPASESVGYGWNSFGGVEMYYKLNSTFENNTFQSISLPWNHSEFIEKPVVLDDCDEPALITLVVHDLYTVVEETNNDQRISRMWYVFFTRESSDISYTLFLNADFFSKEEMIILAKSVEFKDGAFDIKVE